MASPYPWHYTARWLYYYFRPSTKNHTGLRRYAITHDFAPRTDVCRLMFFGDLMCMRGDRVPTVNPALCTLLESADLVIGNCEAPVVFEASRPDAMHLTHFGMAEEFLAGFLEALHVRPERCVLSVANNHMGDRGVEGLATTVERLARVGVKPVGRAGESTVNVDCNGLRIGFAAWTQWLNFEVFDNGDGVARAARDDWSAVRADLDTLVVTPHWEYEFQHFPCAKTRSLAADLCSGGVDLIVGHHPHVIQPVEWFDDALCLYSIGNLNGPSYSHVSWPVQLTGIFEARIHADGPRRGKVQGYTFHPFAQLIAEDRSATLVPLDDAPADLAPRLKQRLDLLFDL